MNIISETTILAQVMAAREATGVTTTTSHLIARAGSVSPRMLHHAVKLRSGQSSKWLKRMSGRYNPKDASLTRWLVWIGDARPPGPPSHVRIGLVDTAGQASLTQVAEATGLGSTVDTGVLAAVLLPIDGGEAFRVVARSPGRADVMGPVDRVWQEIQVHDGRQLADEELQVAGLVAEPHHHQLIDPTSIDPAEDHLVLLIRPDPARAARP